MRPADTATEGTDYGTIGSLTLTIAAGSASGTQTFTLLPTDDDVAGVDRALTVDGSVTGLDVTAAAVTIEEDDERGVTVTPTSLAVPEAGSGTYTVALTSQPTGTVTVTPSVSGNSEVTVSGALTFTTVNWGTAQPVTVSAAADTDAVNDAATVTHAVAGGDYGTETASDVAVTVTDDETVSTGVVLSVNPETVSEDAGATVVTVTGTLNHAPRLAETVVTLTVGATTDTATEGTDYGTIGSLTLTIAAGSASGTQTFTLLPTDDDVAGADRALTVDGSVTGLDVTAAAVTIEEDDERGVTVTPTSLAVPEAGSGTYTVALTSQPTGTVTVTPSVSGNSEVTVSGALTFTTVNWGTAQPVTVSAAADTDAVNDTATVTHAVAGGDYGTVTASDVAVTVADDETVSTEVVLSVNPATVSEDAGATVVTVTGTLNHAPRLAETAVTLTVGAAGDTAVEGTDYGTIGSLTLTIAAGSASGTQTFTLLPTDDDVAGADRALTVDGSVTGLDVTAAAVTIEEDDERGVTVTPTSLAVPEAGSGTYTVALTSQPTGTVTVTPSVSGNSEVTVSGALTFTASDWNQAQTVTVSAQDDADAVNDTATVAHTVVGGDYGTVTASDVAVTVADDETVSTEVTLTVDPATLDEGDGATTVTVTGTLNGGTRDAATAVTVSVGTSDDSAVEGTDYATVEDLTLTIGAGQTAATQTFMLNPTDDDVDEANEALTVAGGTTATGFTVNGTTVTIADDDERGVSVTASTLVVLEGGSGTYTVVLTSQPTGTVTVTPWVSGNSEVTVSGALTFTASDWTQAQTVTVSAQDDADAVNDTATVAHTVSGGDYGTVTASDVAVTVTDDETVSTAVTLTVDPATLDEGDGATTVTVTGTLNGGTRDAATAVTVSVGASDDSAVEGTDYATVEDLTLTIGAGQTAATQTFMLNPTDDDVDEANEALTVAGGTTATGFTVNGTTVTIADDDERGVSVTPTSLAVPEAGSGTYTVALTSQPTGTVTVTPSVSGNSEVTVSGALTFTTVNWGTAQPVTVSAAADTDAVNDTATVTHAVAGGDYGTVTASDVAVTVTDDETVSTDATLSALGLKDAPGGNTIFLTLGGNRTYTASVVNAVASVTVEPETWDSNATVAYLNASDTTLADADMNKTGFQVALAEGANTIKVKVRAEDGVTTLTYTITVTRAVAANNAPGQVTGLTATARVNKVTLAWPEPLGTILGYRIEASYDGGTDWAAVEDNTNGTGTTYAHGSGLMAGETRHYRVSAITDDGAGPPSIAVEVNTTDTVDGLTATGLAIEDTPNGRATIDLCWKPADVAVSDLRDFAIRERRVHPSLPAEWSDQYWAPRGKSTAAECEAGSIGFRVTGSIAENVRYAYQIRARYGMRWALSNDAEAASVNPAMEFRAEVLTGNSGLSVDTDVPATVCPAYDDPATSETDAGSFIVNIGFSTQPAVFLYYEEVTGFVLDDDVTLENATAELIDRPYGAQLGYRVRITPTTWGQPVAVSVPAGVVTHPELSVPNQASNVFSRNTSASTNCDTGSDIMVYPPTVRRTEILDDDDRSGVWSTGERIRATLEFSEPVTVTTDNGIPTVSLSLDGETVQASYAGETGGDTLVFEHVVTAEQNLFNSARLLANSLSLNGGAIASPDGPAAALAHPEAVKRKEPATKPQKKPATEPKLTAEWVKFPPGHSGDGRKFTVRVKFSDPVTISGRYFRDDALSVTGGVVDKVWRVKDSDGERRSDMWAIRLMPTSQQPLSLSLAAIQDCSAHGAICTADGTPLSNAASITVPGPNHDLTVADAEVEEAPGAALAFVVTLSGTAPYRVKVDYRTVDGTATAGEDYTATSGTLIFERGETSQTVSVPVLDDAHDDDGETLTLTLSNAKRGMIVDAAAVGTIHNSDPMPQAWLARFGRTVADQVLAAVEGRLKAARVPGVEAQLAGQRIAGPAAPDTEKAHEAEAEARLLALSDWLRGAACPDESERQGECALGGQARFDSRKLTGRDFLTGSSFTLTGGTREGGVGALWAQGTVGRFEGREGALSLDGEVLSGMLGADWTRGRGTAGFVLAHSRGDGDYRSESGGGEVSSTLTGIYPYGRYAVNERLSMWGIVGYGAGELGLTPEGSSRLEADIDLAMAAAGARSTVLDGGDNGPTAALTADVLIVRTKADGAPGPAASKAEVTRLRLGLEGSWPFPLEGGALVTPSVEIGLRQDGGDAEAGFGADIGAGLAWEDPQRGLKAEVRGRGLLTHEDANFRERGFAASFAWNPTPGSKLGPSLTLRQSVGASATGGMDALLSRGTMAGVATNDNRENVARRLEVKLGYGLPVAGDRFIGTPEIGVGFSDTGREYSLGWGLGLARRDRGSLDLSLEGTRHESANGDRGPEHGIGLRLRARW